MARPIWKGDISFGLVSIPISIIPAEEKKDISFHLLDSKDKSRIQYQRINSETGKEVSWNEVVKGYEFEKGNYIIVDEKNFEKASPDLFKSIDIEEFVDLKSVDTLYFQKPYYILPESKNKKAYVLLRESLKKTNKVGVAKVIIKTKEYLSLILPHQNALLLYLIHFHDEIRQEEELNFPTESLKAYKISEGEFKMAMELIKSMTAKWKPEKYHNEYKEVMKKWLDEQTARAETHKVSGKKIKRTPKKSDIVDFVTLLKQSMKKKKTTEKKTHRKHA